MKDILITDLHFGNKNNSQQHNEDLLDFFEYLINWKTKQPEEHYRVVILGDLFQQRDKLDVNTVNYAIVGIEMLSEAFGKDNVIVIKGNHDLYYRDTRQVSSLEIFRDKVRIVDDTLIEDNRMYVAWLCNGEEFDTVVNMSKQQNVNYVFGHFEFATFKMNDTYIMEHGHTHKSLSHINTVFSGHYHMHQEKDNIIYVGTPFPFDMNDANDSDRGFMVFDTETGKTDRILYEKIKVLSISHTELMAGTFDDVSNTTIRIVIDDELSDKELDQIREKIEGTAFRESKIVYKLKKDESHTEEQEFTGEIASIDDMVLSYIKGMTEVEGIDKDLLTTIYKGAISAKD